MREMNTNSKNHTQCNSKKSYLAPEVQIIDLDNEISLALESNPAEGPGEQVYNCNIQKNPFKTESC